MRRVTTIVLGIVLVLLGGYVYFFELSKGERDRSEKLVRFESADVAGLSLAYPDREIQLQRESSGKWKIVQPLQAPADDGAVASLLAALTASEIKRTLEKTPAAEDLRRFGLSPPAVKVSTTMKNGLTLPPLVVGAQTALGDSTYVQRGGGATVYLTDATLAFALNKQPNDLRDRTILSFPLEQAARIEIRAAGAALKLAKGEKGEWALEGPPQKNAKADAVMEYLMTLARLRAKSFIDDRPAEVKKYGLEPPAAKISVTAKDGGTIASLETGAKSGSDYYARREGFPTVYAIDEASYKQLQKTAADFAAEEKSPAK